MEYEGNDQIARKSIGSTYNLLKNTDHALCLAVHLWEKEQYVEQYKELDQNSPGIIIKAWLFLIFFAMDVAKELFNPFIKCNFRSFFSRPHHTRGQAPSGIGHFSSCPGLLQRFDLIFSEFVHSAPN